MAARDRRSLDNTCISCLISPGKSAEPLRQQSMGIIYILFVDFVCVAWLPYISSFIAELTTACASQSACASRCSWASEPCQVLICSARCGFRGRGQVTAVATAMDVVIVVTSRAFLLRYDLSQGMTPGIGPAEAISACETTAAFA